MPLSSVSIRRYICWPPALATEPTNTIVLTGKTGVFVDVRFMKGTTQLDWAFAGFRSQVSEDTVQFKHLIDSRTNDPLGVQDIGKNSILETGQVLESGEMVNPEIGVVAVYEELWEDVPIQAQHTALFIKNKDGTRWQAKVENWQIGLGRDAEGIFWAWQAVITSGEHGKDSWKVLYATDNARIKFMPFENNNNSYVEGTWVDWDNDCWYILDSTL